MANGFQRSTLTTLFNTHFFRFWKWLLDIRLSREQTVLIRTAPISSKTNPGYISYTNQEGNKSNSAGSTESKLGRVFPHLYKQIGSAFFAPSLLSKLRYKLEAERSNKTVMSNLQKLQKSWETRGLNTDHHVINNQPFAIPACEANANLRYMEMQSYVKVVIKRTMGRRVR